MTEIDSFLKDEGWNSIFGEPIVFQEPDKLDNMQGKRVDFNRGYTYLVQFTYGQYYSGCNNFWWVAPYCAKGLWRQEILFAIEVMNSYVRQELLTMLMRRYGIG